MAPNPLKILTKRFRASSLILLGLLTLYVSMTLIIFFEWVIPSYAENTTSQVFCVDSTVYVYMADSLREGRNEPWVLSSLAFFPNTLWTPVLTALVLNSAFLEMLFNYTILGISIWLLKRCFPISLGTFVLLLLLNPRTTTSLLCVNKEIFDLLAISMFLYSRSSRNTLLLLAALGLALLNRWEICLVMIVFLIAQSRLNPWRARRLATLILTIVALNFAVPFWGGEMLARRFEEVQGARTIAFLDTMQMHYMYALAVAPKIAQNLFGFILDIEEWKGFSSWGYIMIFDNVAFAILTFIAVKMHVLKLRNDLIYLGALGAVIIAQSLVPQPRYFYFLYILLCLQVAQMRADKTAERGSLPERSMEARDVSMLDHKEVALG